MRKHLFVGVAAGALFLAACGGDDEEAGSSEPAAATTGASTPATEPAAATTAPADGTTTPTDGVDTTAAPDATDAPGTTVADAPQRIVSISPALTEILFAVGAGDQVVAVDDFSNYPAEVLELPNDLSGYEPNIEAIATYEPDLVVTSGEEVVAPLEALGIEVWVGPTATTLAESYDQIEQLGAITGHVGEAAEVVLQMETGIQAIVDSMPTLDAPLTVYHELTQEYYSADSTTFIGQAYSLLGLQNIADQAEGDNGGYPQLSAESIIQADPDLIFLADTKCCQQDAATVGARPGWDAIAAVLEGNVFEMDDDVASRWGPRFVEYMQLVADAVTQAAAVTAGG